MRDGAHPPLPRLTGLCVGGGVVTLLTPIMLILPAAQALPGGHGFAAVASPRGIYLLVWFSLLAAGATVSWVAQSRLEKGLRLAWWSEGDVESLRKQINREVWTYVTWGLLLAYLVMLVFAPRRTPFSVLAYPLLLPMQTISRLRQALRPPKSPESGIPWGQFEPIHSDHWGERSAPN